MNIAVIGTGLMGKKRAEAAVQAGLKVKYVSDLNESLAKELAALYNATVLPWKECVKSDVDIVFVCTTHSTLHEITLAAIKTGKHVLVEKPAGSSVKELQELVDAQKQSSKFVKVGYNHRFHPMIAKAKELANKNFFGKLLYVTGEYGHGGRSGMENEWRCNKSLGKGGELLDQGSHLIDLYKWFFGNPVEVKADIATYAWKSKDPVEDNAFLIMKNKTGNVGQFHVSWTMWKNFFQMKLTGEKSAAFISGLGRSYGPEKITVYSKDMGKVLFEESYSGDDNSFTDEIKYFVQCINDKKQPEGNLYDALENMKVIEEVYGQ